MDLFEDLKEEFGLISKTCSTEKGLRKEGAERTKPEDS